MMASAILKPSSILGSSIANVTKRTIILTAPGTIVAGAGQINIPLPFNGTIVALRATVGTAPTGADIVLDIKKSGASIYTTQSTRPRITAGTTVSSTTVPQVPTFAAGNTLSVDIVQVGSTVAGSDLTIALDLIPAAITSALVFAQTGVQVVSTGALRYPLGAGTLVSVRLSVGTAPTGADLIVNLKKNGTTLFTDQTLRPRIIAGSLLSSVVSIPTTAASVVSGDYLTADVDQIGSTVAGSDLTIVVEQAR